MEITQSQMGDYCVIRLCGNIDAAHTPKLKKFFKQTQNVPSPKVILDMAEVEFVDSTGLGAFISFFRNLKENNGVFKLASLSDQVRTIFEITRLYRVFEIYDSLEAALDS